MGVPAETSRRLACDAARLVMTHAPDGSVLDVGRRTRTVPPAIRRALEARDGGCRFPGCGLRFCEAHHVTHWADCRATRLENLILLCRLRHRPVHEGGFRVMISEAGEPCFHRPDGRSIPEVPAAPPVPDAPAAALECARLTAQYPDSNRDRQATPGHGCRENLRGGTRHSTVNSSTIPRAP